MASMNEPRIWLLNRTERTDEALFLHGGCHIFALTLHKWFSYPLVACRMKDDGIAHCYALRDGKGVDAAGSIERPYFHEEFNVTTEKWIEPADLRAYFLRLFPREDSERLWSHGNKTFNEIVDERACVFIASYPDRFGELPAVR